LTHFVIMIVSVALFVVSATNGARAASDCAGLKTHISLAQTALVEADVYLSESDTDMTATYAKVADHEIRVALELGDPIKCLSSHDFLAYTALEFHNNTFQSDGHSSKRISDTDHYMHTALNQASRSWNPSAFRAMEKYTRTMDAIAAHAKAEAAEMTHSVNYHNAIRRCRLFRENREPNSVYVSFSSPWNASMDIDAEGHVSNVVFNMDDQAANVTQDDLNRLTEKLQGLQAGPATVFNPKDMSCRSIASHVIVVNGFVKFYTQL
jgi:hypothetical protein